MGNYRFEIPGSWTLSCIGDIGQVMSGGTPSTKDSSNFGEDINWITPADLSKNDGIYITKGARSLSLKGLTQSSAKLLPERSIIFSSRAPIGYVAIATEPFATNQGCKNLVPSSYIDNKYIYYYLLSAKTLAESVASGTTFLEISAKGFASLPIPIPPLKEQKRIVDKLEELFSDLDVATEDLLKAKKKLQKYRMSILNAAVTGELTKEWREEHPVLKGDKEEYLKKVDQSRKDKNDLYQKKLNKRRKLKPPVEIPQDVSQSLPPIPSQWTWITLDRVTWSVKDGPHYSPKYVEEGIPFISGGNVRPTGVDFETAKRISLDLHKELSTRCKPEIGDILYTKGGTTGIARVNTYPIEFNVWVHVAVLKLTEHIEPFYVQHILNSPFCYTQAQKYTHGVGNQDLGLTRMIKIILPLPPVDEQKVIVSKVENVMSILDYLEKELSKTEQQIRKFRSSILQKAFSGQLVPQDPNDEPASVLLERIKAEKEELPSNKPSRATKKPKVAVPQEV